MFTFVACIIYPVPEGEIETVIFPPTRPDIPEIPRPGEIFPVLVEGDCHNPVGCVEGLLDPVTVVDVDVYVENPLVVLQQFQDREHNIIYVAET